MPVKIPIEDIVERAIRHTLSDLKSLQPAERMAALKLSLDFLKYRKVIETAGEFGREFQDTGSAPAEESSSE